MIRQDSFLSKENFRILHNFMIRFYKLMGNWCTIESDDIELCILPYWGNPVGAESFYEFNCEPLQNFSYETAVKKSKLANDIARILKGDYQYGALEFSPYTIAKELMEGYNGLSAQFDEIWAIVYMMQSLKIIVVNEILDDEQGRVYYTMKVLL